MTLNHEDSESFYKLFLPLLDYVNEKKNMSSIRWSFMSAAKWV